MPVIKADNAKILQARVDDRRTTPNWRPIHRIESPSASLEEVGRALETYTFEKLVYAEGDSWFDKFTPLFAPDTNLLDALRLPMFVGVVDVSHIGDISDDMVSGIQGLRTKNMFEKLDFDAILFSGGGNDLKNLFANEYLQQGSPVNVEYDAFFDKVIQNIKDFVAMRDQFGSKQTRQAPILVNGYEYLQPRPVKGTILGDLLKVAGPWIYPCMQHAGLNDGAMLDAVKKAIDKLNERLAREIAILPNVFVIDQRGVLTLAEPGSTSVSGDWLDEIHPTAQGFEKLAQHRWNAALADGLGWKALS